MWNYITHGGGNGLFFGYGFESLITWAALAVVFGVASLRLAKKRH